MISGAKSIERTVTRVRVFDARRRLLLLRTRDFNDVSRGVWGLPGGALEPGESPQAAACRELLEETGIARTGMGECVARVATEFVIEGQEYRQIELIFAVLIDERDIAVRVPTQDRFLGSRWWDLDDLVSYATLVYPENLPELAQRFVETRRPQAR